MKKLILSMATAAMALVSCQPSDAPSKAIENHLTDAEKQERLITPDVMLKMSRIGGGELSKDGSKLLYTITNYSVEENRSATLFMVQDMATKEAVAITNAAYSDNSPVWAPDGESIYFLSNRSGSMQIWKMNSEGESLTQITNIEGDVEGFGIAPTEQNLYYVKRVEVCDRRSSDRHKDMDKSKARIYEDLMVRHWDYWDEGSYLHIFVAPMAGDVVTEGVDIVGEDSAWDTPLAPYFDMSEMGWSSDGSRLAYTCKPLVGAEYAVSTDSDVFVYDIETKETQNICKSGEAINPHARIMPQMMGYDKYPVYSPDSKQIAFISQRRPGNESDKARLFIYNVEDGAMSDLTENFDYNAMNVVWGDDGNIYFIAPINATHQICRVPAAGGEVEVITKGDHDISSFTMVGDRIVAQRSTLQYAHDFFEVDRATGELTQISFVNKEIYDNVDLCKVEKRWVKTTDNKQMLTWVCLPPNFDENKKYPALLYCQGGPQSVVSNGWNYRWNFEVMASQGYVVVMPNRRGLPSFGQEWLDQISGDYSGQNIQDYLSAIDDVATEKWVDADRMGAVGASYGGYSVYYLAGVHEGRFKAFISHCGIFNFESMYGGTEELFFLNNDYGGNYWDKSNPTAMRSYANSPHKLIEKWDTPIMIVTGERDFRIPYTQSLEAFTAAKMRGLDARLVEFENEAHQVFQPQNSLVWHREFYGWLDKYLK